MNSFRTHIQFTYSFSEDIYLMYVLWTHARSYICVCMYVLYLLPSLSLLFDLPCMKSSKGMLPHTHTYMLYIHTYIHTNILYKQLGKSNRCKELLHFLFDDWDVEAVHYQVRVIGNLTQIMSVLTSIYIHTTNI